MATMLHKSIDHHLHVNLSASHDTNAAFHIERDGSRETTCLGEGICHHTMNTTCMSHATHFWRYCVTMLRCDLRIRSLGIAAD